MQATTTLPRVTSVEPLESFRLRLSFTDGVVREVDLSHDLWGQMTEPLQDPDYFRRVSVDTQLGTVVWPNDYALDPDVLHGDYEPSNDLWNLGKRSRSPQPTRTRNTKNKP